jgi:hypothetical protein
VVIPACNEEETIGECLHTIGNAVRRLHLQRNDVRVHVVVVIDSCTDATELIARAVPGIDAVATDCRSVGQSRALGTQRVLEGARLPPDQVWLANTDADSRVPATWLTTMLADAEQGYDLVLGTVAPGPGLPRHLVRAWQSRHIAIEGHPHVHGANLGIRAGAYLRLGGWPDVRTGEDVLLAGRAEATDRIRVRRSGATPVSTSSRMVGRAPHGFAHYLRDLAEIRYAVGPATAVVAEAVGPV